MGPRVRNFFWHYRDVPDGKKISDQKLGYKKQWEDILKKLHTISQNEDLVDKRIRILIKNTFTLKEQDWNKDNDEGPLKLKELHKRVRKEQAGEYEQEYEKKPRQKREERKSKNTGGGFFGKPSPLTTL